MPRAACRVPGTRHAAHGTLFAAPACVIRRVSAFLGIVALVAVALLLMWRVYAHHRGVDSDENAVVWRIEEKICQTLS